MYRPEPDGFAPQPRMDQKRLITLCYRKVIDARQTGRWEKLVFDDTYTEFKMQAQLYNPDKTYRTYAELIKHADGAKRLPFLVSSAIMGYMRQLDNYVPDVHNSLGRRFLKFEKFDFEIINSDLQDQAAHTVAISFFTEQLIWHETVNDQLLVSANSQTTQGYTTHLVQLRPFLSIHTLLYE